MIHPDRARKGTRTQLRHRRIVWRAAMNIQAIGWFTLLECARLLCQRRHRLTLRGVDAALAFVGVEGVELTQTAERRALRAWLQLTLLRLCAWGAIVALSCFDDEINNDAADVLNFAAEITIGALAIDLAFGQLFDVGGVLARLFLERLDAVVAAESNRLALVRNGLRLRIHLVPAHRALGIGDRCR
jgi:hypothetical protein